MTTAQIIWLIIAAIYFILVSTVVFYYFAARAPRKEREFWTVLLVWAVSLILGPVLIIVGIGQALTRKFKK